MFFDMSLSFAGEMCPLNLDSISKDKMRLVFVSLSLKVRKEVKMPLFQDLN